jgi:uncharacterized membrane protein YeaQ/YmgE (transglycosylase-associated protein family)
MSAAISGPSFPYVAVLNAGYRLPFSFPDRCNPSAARAFPWGNKPLSESVMSGVGLLGALVIGILAGWIAERVMARNHGLLTNLIVGVVGSFIGAFLAEVLGFTYSGFWASLVVSALGAIVLLFLLNLFRGRSISYRS